MSLMLSRLSSWFSRFKQLTILFAQKFYALLLSPFAILMGLKPIPVAHGLASSLKSLGFEYKKNVMKHPDLKKLLEGFEYKLKNLFQQKKRQHRNKPWVLVVGQKGVGKTSWLSQATAQASQIVSHQEEASQLYVTDTCIFLDVAGLYCESEWLAIWPHLCKILKRYGIHPQLKSIIWMIDIAKLLQSNKEEQQQLISSFRYILQYLSVFKPSGLSITLICTHVDELLGFKEFFEDLDAKDRDQVWGIELPTGQSSASVSTHFETEFLRLVNQLNHLMLNQLHQERHLQKRSLVVEFPLQFETLQLPLNFFLKSLLSAIQSIKKATRYEILGVYFSSANQTAKQLDRFAKAIQQNLQLPLASAPSYTIPPKSYFVLDNAKYLVQKIYQTQLNQFKRVKLHNAIAMVIAANLVLAGGLWFFHDYRSSANRISQAEDDLENYQHAMQNVNRNNAISPQVLLAFEAVEHAKTTLDQHKSLRDKVNTAYATILQTQFLPSIAHYLEQMIEARVDSTNAELYQLLKAYLMLGQLSNKDNTFIQQLVEHYWREDKSLGHQQFTKLKQYLAQALQTQMMPLPINQSLIAKARGNLSDVPYGLLLYLTLKQQYQNEVNVSELKVPKIYTKSFFTEFFAKIIPQFVQQAVHGDWVLNKESTALAQISPQDLMEQLRSFYLADYVNWWNLSLLKAQNANFGTLQEAANALKDYAQNGAPVYHLLQAVLANTNQMVGNDTVAQTFNENVYTKFQSIYELLPASQPQALFSQVKKNLLQLNQHINIITHANNPSQAAFLAAKSRMQLTQEGEDVFNALAQNAERTPEPMKTWLNSLVKSTWGLLLQQAQNFIESEWQQQVFNEYRRNLDQRYPLFKQADNEINLDNFHHFFAPNGIFQTFTVNYLLPFIDTNGSTWKPKVMNGLGITIKEEMIRQLERANIMQKMFYTDQSSALQVRFTLQPLNFEPIVKKMTLNINGQLLEDQQGEHTISNFTWPGNRQPNIVQLEFSNIDGQFSSLTTDGDWALFRLLDRANIQAESADSRYYQVVFDLNGNATRYQVAAKQEINPFMPNILDHFRLSEHLFG